MSHTLEQDFSATAAGIAHGLSHALGLNVQVQHGACPHTDTTGVLVVPPPSSESQADVEAWHGLLDHESAHVLYTHDPKGDLKERAGDAAEALNWLEDCRINEKLAEKYHGCGANLRAAYRKTRHDAKPESWPPSATVAIGACCTISPAIVSPFQDCAPLEGPGREAWDKAQAWGLANRDAILGAPSCESLIPLAQELTALMREADEAQPPPPPKEPGKSKPEKGEGKPEPSPADSTKSEGESEGDEETKPEKPEGEGESKDQPTEEGKEPEGEASRGTTESAPKPDAHPLDISRVAESDKPRTSSMSTSRQGRADLRKFASDTARGIVIGWGSSTPLVEQVYNQGAGIAADLRTAVQTRTHKRRLGEQDEGQTLDESQLAGLAARIPGTRPWQSVTGGMYPDTAVAIVLDGSGSMRAAVPETVGSRWHAACGAGAALANALAQIPRTKAIVWGTPNYSEEKRGMFKEERSTAILLSDWGQRPTLKDANRWAQVYPSSETECWASNVRLAIPLLRAQPCKRRIVLLITDGDLTHSDQRKELSNADKQAQALGVEVYGVAWGPVADWQGKIPKERTLQDPTPLPTRAWLRAVARLLLKGSL
jgi:hypothetical protein